MCEPKESSHVKSWLLSSLENLDLCRARANRLARTFLAKKDGDKTESSTVVECFARDFDSKKSDFQNEEDGPCLLYTSPSPRDKRQSRMPSSA